MDEKWIAAPGWEDRVEVSNFGRVRSFDYLAKSTRALQPTQLRKGRMLRPDLRDNGYLSVKVKTAGVSERRYVHRLVAAAFVPGFFADATVDHIDGNRRNNVATNLDWVTRSENSKRQNAAGRGVGRGNENAQVKLRDEDVPIVLLLRASGSTQREIAARFGVSESLIYKIERGLRRGGIPRTA